jgi:hypothetical protein
MMTDDDIAAGLYDALLRRSRREFAERARSVEIPGELSFFLDEIVALSGEQSAQETIAEVIDLGIVAWFRRLGDDRLRELGLPALSRDGDGGLESALAAERAKVEKLAREIDELTSAQAQPKREWKQHGYIPLTSHGGSKASRPRPTSHAKKGTR